MTDPKPTRNGSDLAEMLDTLLDKGVVVNADVAVTVGDTELLGIQLRAAIASFETAAEYGLAFPAGTDMEQVREAADVETVRADAAAAAGVNAAGGGERVPFEESASDPRAAGDPDGDDADGQEKGPAGTGAGGATGGMATEPDRGPPIAEDDDD